VTVTFTPTSEGYKSGTITIISNAKTQTVTCPVSGTGVSATPPVTVPSVSTGDPDNFAQTTATVSGNVTSNGGAAITERGICYCKTTEYNPPTIHNGKKVTANSNTTGSFTCGLANLEPNTYYFARAYAINSSGLVGYGITKQFKTMENVTPTVTITAASATSQTTATATGSVILNGTTIAERGICYSDATTNPTINNSRNNQVFP
jgi:hypothetical protein